MIKRSVGEHIFDIVNVILLVFIAFITLYPFWYVLVASLSEPTQVTMGNVTFWPIGFEFASYLKVFNMPYIWTSYGNTILIAVGGTTISMVGTILTAYATSKQRLVGRKFFIMLMLIPMWFSAGLIPTYINIKNLGLLNNRLALMLNGAISTFYVILMRTYFESISDSLEESAKMDGASDWFVLLKIYVPLSVPCLMTITMYYFVARWNAYFDAMIYLKDEWKVPLQVLLKKIVVQSEITSETMDVSTATTNQQTIIYSTIMLAALPMICLYPFVQKFFVKGIMIGAVKG